MEKRNDTNDAVYFSIFYKMRLRTFPVVRLDEFEVNLFKLRTQDWMRDCFVRCFPGKQPGSCSCIDIPFLTFRVPV